MSVNSKLYMGNINADNIYMGESPVDAIYVGNDLVYSVGEPPVPPQPKNKIWYTSSDDNIVTPYSTTGFGANIVSNTYVDGQGIIEFDGDVTSIGSEAFNSCMSLTEITIPDSVTSIGDYAFNFCFSLERITIESTTPATLGSVVFEFSNDCPIYVPLESVDAYKTAWSDYDYRIFAIPE